MVWWWQQVWQRPGGDRTACHSPRHDVQESFRSVLISPPNLPFCARFPPLFKRRAVWCKPSASGVWCDRISPSHTSLRRLPASFRIRKLLLKVRNMYSCMQWNRKYSLLLVPLISKPVFGSHKHMYTYKYLKTYLNNLKYCFLTEWFLLIFMMGANNSGGHCMFFECWVHFI